jgi:hypothetical protein
VAVVDALADGEALGDLDAHCWIWGVDVGFLFFFFFFFFFFRFRFLVFKSEVVLLLLTIAGAIGAARTLRTLRREGRNKRISGCLDGEGLEGDAIEC